MPPKIRVQGASASILLSFGYSQFYFRFANKSISKHQMTLVFDNENPLPTT